MTDPIAFDGRVAVVTGAGGGLGRSYAIELGRRGARVVVNDLGGAVDGTGASTSPADAVVAEITATGGEAIANYDSVSTPEGGEAIVGAALDAFGTVDIVVSNAGILRDRSYANMSAEEVEAVIQVHLQGGFNVSRPAFRVMKEKGFGRFVFASSGSGLFGNFGQANYAAAKMGLVGLSNVISIEGAKYDIRSNAIAPIAGTRMTQDILGPMAEAFDPDQVTPLVVFLCSEANPYTHEVFTVGGGRYGRVFVGTNQGWFAGAGTVPSVEDVAAHMGEIRDLSDYLVPSSSTEEIMLIGQMLSG